MSREVELLMYALLGVCIGTLVGLAIVYGLWWVFAR